MSYRVVVGIRGWTNVVVIGKARQDRRLVAGFQIDDVDEQDDAVFLAGIVAALEHGEVQQIGVADLQAFDDGGAQFIGGVIEGQGEFVDANHGGNPGRWLRQRKQQSVGGKGANCTRRRYPLSGWPDGSPEGTVGRRGAIPFLRI
ncbi:hypothetical protein D3C78_1122220 [compost metagenome]